jgi:hypothetical protein
MALGSHPCDIETGLPASAPVLHFDRCLSLIPEAERRVLALERCAACWGTGKKGAKVCACVLRAIFSQCWKQCCLRAEDIEPRRQYRGSRAYSFPGLEYSVDFLTIAKRTLSAEDWRVFEVRYLGQADWRTACRRLSMDKGKFHHSCYRIEERIGRACVETEPFALYPIRDYFITGRPVRANVVEMPRQRQTEAILRTVAAAG